MKNKTSISFFSKSKILALFFSVIVLKYAFILIYVDLVIPTWDDFYEDLVFFLVIIFLYFGFKNKYLRRILLFLYLFYFTMETCSYLAVGSNFTSSFMYVLIETSTAEFKEFSSAYFNSKIGIYILLSIAIYISILNYSRSRKSNYSVWIGFVFTFVAIVFLKLTGLIESNAYHNVVRGVYGYFELQNGYELNKDNIKTEDLSIISDNEIMVIVLGESTSRRHMQLYGYPKETSPLLSSINDGLHVYNNVISADILTLKAVPKMFSSISNEDELISGKEQKPINTIVEIFNKAGYETFWLSNQRPISYHDNAISKIASFSTSFKFYNYKVDKYATVYDEVLLPDYKNILKKNGKKLIILRLLGTHFDYHKRYPDSFNKFKPKNDSQKEIIISQYDNANLYNDYIVSTILEELNKVKNKSALIFLSDHGENVFDDGEFFGRVENNIRSNMFEIPFVLWTSESFEKPKDFEFDPDRKFMTDHLYESIGHLFGIVHKDMELNRSIFSKNFQERKRNVLNELNFDEYFYNQE